jgi:hypothetical protein
MGNCPLKVAQVPTAKVLSIGYRLPLRSIPGNEKRLERVSLLRGEKEYGTMFTTVV